MKTYTSYQNDIPRIINNSLADNLTWANEMIMDAIRLLVTRYYFNERSYTISTVAQQQFYNLPPQVKKLLNVTVTIGNVVWQPKECPSRQFWDALNSLSAFYQDYPSYFYVFNGQMGLYPTPSSGGNTITMNYKTRIVDLSMSDATAGTINLTNGSTAVSGIGTSFANWMTQGGWLRPSHSTTNALNGDNQWYEISSVSSPTALTLKAPYQGSTVTGATGPNYTIGEVSILPEDYQQLPLYYMGMVYYSTRQANTSKFEEYKQLWNDGLAALDAEFGSKTTNVALVDTDAQIINPNLFVRTVS